MNPINQSSQNWLIVNQSINQLKVYNEGLRLIDWFCSFPGKMPYGCNSRVNAKKWLTQRDNTVHLPTFNWHLKRIQHVWSSLLNSGHGIVTCMGKSWFCGGPPVVVVCAGLFTWQAPDASQPVGQIILFMHTCLVRRCGLNPLSDRNDNYIIYLCKGCPLTLSRARSL